MLLSSVGFGGSTSVELLVTAMYAILLIDFTISLCFSLKKFNIQLACWKSVLNSELSIHIALSQSQPKVDRERSVLFGCRLW